MHDGLKMSTANAWTDRCEKSGIPQIKLDFQNKSVIVSIVNNKPILATLLGINSKRDTHGNCYWAFVYTDALTGNSVSATISGGSSNIQSIVAAMGMEASECYVTFNEMKIRAFDKYVKKLPYAGCTGEELAKFIRANLVEKKD